MKDTPKEGLSTLDEYIVNAIPVSTMINFYGTKRAAIDEYNF